MKINRWVGLALLAAVGCQTVHDARKAQRELAPRGEDAVTASARLDLRGRSLADLVGFAMTNRPAVVSARLAVADARLALKALKADAPVLSDTPWTAPKLSASIAHRESSEAVKLDDGDWRTAGNASGAISLELLVWDFGRYNARAGEQAEKVVAAETQLAEIGYTVFGEVASAYFTFLERCSLQEVAETNVVNYADHLARAEARAGAGEAYKLDVLKARLDLAQARQALVAASNLVDTAGAALMNALGVEETRGTCEQVFGRRPVGMDGVRRGFRRTDFTVDEAFQLARTNAPAIKVNRAQLRAASKAVDYAVADLLPSISASASFSWSDPLWMWNWGVSGVQSLFQGFRKTTAVDRAVVAMKRASATLDQTEQELSLELETAIANRDNSVSALLSAQASQKSAKENLQLVQEQLTLGDVSRIELSEAISSHSKAIGDCISAFYDGQRAEARLFALLGSEPIYHEEIIKEEK